MKRPLRLFFVLVFLLIFSSICCKAEIYVSKVIPEIGFDILTINGKQAVRVKLPYSVEAKIDTDEPAQVKFQIYTPKSDFISSISGTKSLKSFSPSKTTVKNILSSKSFADYNMLRSFTEGAKTKAGTTKGSDEEDVEQNMYKIWESNVFTLTPGVHEIKQEWDGYGTVNGKKYPMGGMILTLVRDVKTDLIVGSHSSVAEHFMSYYSDFEVVNEDNYLKVKETKMTNGDAQHGYIIVKNYGCGADVTSTEAYNAGVEAIAREYNGFCANNVIGYGFVQDDNDKTKYKNFPADTLNTMTATIRDLNGKPVKTNGEEYYLYFYSVPVNKEPTLPFGKYSGVIFMMQTKMPVITEDPDDGGGEEPPPPQPGVVTAGNLAVSLTSSQISLGGGISAVKEFTPVKYAYNVNVANQPAKLNVEVHVEKTAFVNSLLAGAKSAKANSKDLNSAVLLNTKGQEIKVRSTKSAPVIDTDTVKVWEGGVFEQPVGESNLSGTWDGMGTVGTSKLFVDGDFILLVRDAQTGQVLKSVQKNITRFSLLYSDTKFEEEKRNGASGVDSMAVLKDSRAVTMEGEHTGYILLKDYKCAMNYTSEAFNKGIQGMLNYINSECPSGTIVTSFSSLKELAADKINQDDIVLYNEKGKLLVTNSEQYYLLTLNRNKNQNLTLNTGKREGFVTIAKFVMPVATGEYEPSSGIEDEDKPDAPKVTFLGSIRNQDLNVKLENCGNGKCDIYNLNGLKIGSVSLTEGENRIDIGRLRERGTGVYIINGAAKDKTGKNVKINGKVF